MMERNICQKKYWIYGIIGCLCFGIGDWLLGYVDPTLIEEDLFYFIRVGHGVDFQTIRGVITMILAMIGMLFYLPGLKHIADITLDKKSSNHLRYVFELCSIGWFTIHFIVVVNVLVYSWTIKSIGTESAYAISNYLGNALLPCLYIAYIFVAIPLILLIIYIFLGKTHLKKRDIIFTPIIWMIIINVIVFILPSTAFSYGLYTFGMNGGMLVWFIYLLIKNPVSFLSNL